VEVIIACLWT